MRYNTYLTIHIPYNFFIFIFYWDVVDLQCCANFCCIAKWLSCTHIYILLFIHFKYMSHCFLEISQGFSVITTIYLNYEFFIYSRYKSLIFDILCKYFLSSSGLSFYFYLFRPHWGACRLLVLQPGVLNLGPRQWKFGLLTTGLPRNSLSFYFLNSVIWSRKVLNFDIVHCIYFCFCLLCFWCHI